MKTRLLLLIAAFVTLCWLLSLDISKPQATAHNQYALAANAVSQSCTELLNQLSEVNPDWSGIENEFAQLRLSFKGTEMLLWYFNREITRKKLNGAPLPYLEENAPQLSIFEPEGLQRLEELIGEQDKRAALSMLQSFKKNWALINASMQSINLNDRMLLEALRFEIMRIAFLHITGFENPAFTNAIAEAENAWNSMEGVVLAYSTSAKTENTHEALVEAFNAGKQFFANSDFEHFNRIEFIRQAAQPLFGALIKYQEEGGIPWYEETGQLPQAFNSRASQFFSDDFLDPYFFMGLQQNQDNQAMQQLGRYLFFDPVLSSNGERACAGCHKPEKAFSDGLPKSMATGFEGTVQRNAPGLINAVYADRFFYDLRTAPLENQFEHVVFSAQEFNTTYAEITNRLNASAEYQSLFKEAFGEKAGINKNTITTALAAYVASLRSFNSPIDRYLRGEEVTLTTEEIEGFNLFMGKANCGTCHFAPTFSGLVPPYFDESESEILGVPATAANNLVDPDHGRAGGALKESAPIYDHSFKTVTVRNSALTGPYMHNGVYATLEEVVDFYNRGGGEGLGYAVPYQTLPADTLGLTPAEQSALIAFMNALTDTTNLTSQPGRLPEMPQEQFAHRKVGGLY